MRKKNYGPISVLPLFVGLIAFVILVPISSFAKTKVVYATHKTVMGDNDSKNDVRQMCFLEAKRTLLEKAGTYIESHTNVRDFRITKDEISTYAAAILKVEVVKEEWKLVNENLAIVMRVKATVDTDYVERQLAKIKQDVALQNELKSQQKRLAELEQKLATFQKELKSADESTALLWRQKKIATYKNIAEIDARYKQVRSSYHDTIVAERNQLKKVIKYIELGMTQKEVEYILGEPDNRRFYDDGTLLRFYYGNVSITFSSVSYNVVSSIHWYSKKCNEWITIKINNYNILINGISRRQKFCEQDIRKYISVN